MDEQLALELPSGSACVVGDDDLTWDGLIDELIAGGPARRPLDPLAERVALHAACGRLVAADSAGSRGFLRAVARALGELRRAGVGDVATPLSARARRVLRIHYEVKRVCAPL